MDDKPDRWHSTGERNRLPARFVGLRVPWSRTKRAQRYGKSELSLLKQISSVLSVNLFLHPPR
jgi:hypothetical protein